MNPAPPVMRRVIADGPSDLGPYTVAVRAERAPPVSDRGSFRVLQRQSQFLGERIDGSPGPLPCAVGLEAQVADAASPRRDDAADRAEVGPIHVLLVEPADHVGCDPDERAQRRRGPDAVLAAVPRAAVGLEAQVADAASP